MAYPPESGSDHFQTGMSLEGGVEADKKRRDKNKGLVDVCAVAGHAQVCGLMGDLRPKMSLSRQTRSKTTRHDKNLTLCLVVIDQFSHVHEPS